MLQLNIALEIFVRKVIRLALLKHWLLKIRDVHFVIVSRDVS